MGFLEGLKKRFGAQTEEREPKAEDGPKNEKGATENAAHKEEDQAEPKARLEYKAKRGGPETYADCIFEYIVMDNGCFRELYTRLKDKQFSVEEVEDCLKRLDCPYWAYGQTFLSIFEKKDLVTEEREKYTFTKSASILENAADFKSDLDFEESWALLFNVLFPKAMEFERAISDTDMGRRLCYASGYNIAISAIYDRAVKIAEGRNVEWAYGSRAKTVRAMRFRAKSMSVDRRVPVRILTAESDFVLEYPRKEGMRRLLELRMIEDAPAEALKTAKEKYNEMAELNQTAGHSFLTEAMHHKESKIIGLSGKDAKLPEDMVDLEKDAMALFIEKRALAEHMWGLSSVAEKDWKKAVEHFKEGEKLMLKSVKEFHDARNFQAAEDNKKLAEIDKHFADIAKKKAKRH